MGVAIACYGFQDAGVKMLPSQIPLVEILFFRALFALPFLFLFARAEKHPRPWHTRQAGLHLLRALLLTGTTLLYMASFRMMPLTDAYALTFCGPLLVGGLGALWLKEPFVGPRLLTLLAGLMGVFLVCAPDLKDPLLWAIPLAGGACHAVSQVSLRRLTCDDSTTLVMAFFLGVSLLVSAPFVLTGPLTYPPSTLALFALIGAFGALAQAFMSHAFRWGAVTLLAPLEYMSLLWGLGLDGLLWHKMPTPLEITGVMMVLGACAFATYTGLKREEKTI